VKNSIWRPIEFAGPQPKQELSRQLGRSLNFLSISIINTPATEIEKSNYGMPEVFDTIRLRTLIIFLLRLIVIG
jgi:hypothetical protein